MTSYRIYEITSDPRLIVDTLHAGQNTFPRRIIARGRGDAYQLAICALWKETAKPLKHAEFVFDHPDGIFTMIVNILQ